MRITKPSLRLFAALTLLAVALEPLAAQSAVREYRIPQQSLDRALREFAISSGLDLLFSPDLVSGRSGALQGIFTIDEGLRTLLRGTGLEFSLEGSRIVIRESSERQATSSAHDVQAEKSYTLVAQSDAAASSSRAAPVETSREPERRIELEEVLVTGTHIRGATSAGSQLIVIAREDIERSGYTSTERLIRSLPQDFRGGAYGASEDGMVGAGPNAQMNVGGASGINLRGLGNSSTLVLLNGRRMAPAAFGGITDISVVPLAAIERIDVLTDGSSAVYGGDAVAGVVNFVLRSRYDGALTQLRRGEVSEGSLGETTAAQTLGTSWSEGGVVATLQYQDRTALPTKERSYTATTFQPTDLIPETTKYSGLVSASHRFTPGVEVFGDALVSRQDLLRRLTVTATSPRIADADSLQWNTNLGVGIEPFADWRFELLASSSRQEMEVAYRSHQPPLAGYTLGSVALDNAAEVQSIDVKADGTLLALPAGPLRAALGGSRRDEDFVSLIPHASSTDPFRTRGLEREVTSAFAELHVPLFDERTALPLMRGLDLSAAVRYDDYSDFGSTTNPKLGVTWTLLDTLSLRGSWSTSFRAPVSNELLNAFLGTTVTSYQLPAPGGGGPARVFLVSGVSPDLGPEESEAWTAGLDYRPALLPGASLSLNYYDILFRNRIIQPGLGASILLQPGIYGSLITPVTDDAAAAAFLAGQIARGATHNNLFGFGSTGVRYVIDIQLQNAAYVEQSGIDLIARYDFSLGASRFNVGLNASFIRNIITALTPNATPADTVDTYANPLALRMRADVGWSRGVWQINGALNYRGGYIDNSIAPVGSVKPWTTVDVNVRFSPGGAMNNSFLRGLSFGLSASNLLGEDPPYVSGRTLQPSIHFDAANADPYGRFVSVDVQKKW